MTHRPRLVAPLVRVLSACVEHAPRDTRGLFRHDVAVIGHRGAAGLAPENTHAAFLAAASLGVPFELDVTLSATGEVVVIHDDTLDRTTDGAGYVDETPWCALSGLDAGSWFGPSHAGEPLPELGEVLRHFGPQVVVDIELKSPRDPALRQPLAEAVCRLVAEAGLVDRVFVTSFDPYLLEGVRAESPDIRRGQLFGSFDGADLNRMEKFVLRNLLLNGKAVADLLVAEATILRRGNVQRWRRMGYRVLAWTVNDPQEMRRLVDIGVQGLITDRPDLALEVLGR